MNKKLIFIFAFCTFFFASSNAKVFEVLVEEGYNFQWAYLTKFCYTDNPSANIGDFSYSIEGTDAALDGVNLVLYDDESTSWFSFYGKGQIDCWADIAKPPAKAVLPPPSGVVEIQDSSRPHFWYVAVARCNYTQFDQMTINVQFLNPGSWWSRQFSYDDQGLLQLYLIALIVYALLSCLYVYGMRVLKRSLSLHTMVKFFAVCFFLEAGGVLFTFIHYCKYAFDGFGVPGLLGLGSVLEATSHIGFIFLLLLLAKGWTISKPTLDHKKFFVFIFSVIIVLYIALFIWANVGVDPASTIYVYDTLPGVGIAALHLPLLVFFVVSLHKTFSEESSPKKKEFYRTFGFCFCVWFLVLPFIVLVAFFLDPWVRAKTTEATMLSIYTVALCGMIHQLWPTRVAEIFTLSANSVGVLPYDEL